MLYSNNFQPLTSEQLKARREEKNAKLRELFENESVIIRREHVSMNIYKYSIHAGVAVEAAGVFCGVDVSPEEISRALYSVANVDANYFGANAKRYAGAYVAYCVSVDAEYEIDDDGDETIFDTSGNDNSCDDDSNDEGVTNEDKYYSCAQHILAVHNKQEWEMAYDDLVLFAKWMRGIDTAGTAFLLLKMPPDGKWNFDLTELKDACSKPAAERPDFIGFSGVYGIDVVKEPYFECIVDAFTERTERYFVDRDFKGLYVGDNHRMIFDKDEFCLVEPTNSDLLYGIAGNMWKLLGAAISGDEALRDYAERKATHDKQHERASKKKSLSSV